MVFYTLEHKNEFYWNTNLDIQKRKSNYIEKNTIDANKNVRIYYCINGDYKRPENFTDIYSDVIRISEPSVIACYATDDEGILSNVVYFVVTENVLIKTLILLTRHHTQEKSQQTNIQRLNYMRTFGNTNLLELYTFLSQCHIKIGKMILRSPISITFVS